MRPLRSAGFRLFAVLLTRFGLASTYLSGVADRFGVWGRPGAPNVSWGDFQHYVARVQASQIHPSAPIALGLAWFATVLDAALGLGLLIGLRTRTMALASGVWLLVSAVAALFSTGGPHDVLAYGLLGLAGASMLLAVIAGDL
jgi:hypothetical protein